MDSEKCKVLLRVLELNNLSAAAAELGYTPSGISRAVASLEKELGVTLLIRVHGGVRPTPACQTLLPSLRELAFWGNLCQELADQLRGLETGGITVGSAYHAFDRWLTRLAAEFGRQHPGIQVHIMEGTSSTLADRMDRGEMDFAIISRREGHFQWQALCRDPLMVWVPHGHPLEQGFPRSELERVPFIEIYPGQETDNSRFFTAQNIRPDVRCKTWDVRTACSMVQAGLGVAMVNGLTALTEGNDISAAPLVPPELVDIGIATPSEGAISPAARRFASFVAERLEQGDTRELPNLSLAYGALQTKMGSARNTSE